MRRMHKRVHFGFIMIQNSAHRTKPVCCENQWKRVHWNIHHWSVKRLRWTFVQPQALIDISTSANIYIKYKFLIYIAGSEIHIPYPMILHLCSLALLWLHPTPSPRIALFVRSFVTFFLPNLTHTNHTIIWCVSVPNGMGGGRPRSRGPTGP